MFLNSADVGGLEEGKAGCYKHSMVCLSTLRFQLIPGNAAAHQGTVEPKHDDANLRLWRKRCSENVETVLVDWDCICLIFSVMQSILSN